MIEAVRALSAADLREIASAIRAKRLGQPYSAFALRRYVDSDLAALVAGAQLSAKGRMGLA